jgi:hypothetical protein
MFETRSENKSIEFVKFGTSANMPSRHEPQNGDSVKLKYDKYDIDVCSISITSHENFSGVVDSVSISGKEQEEEIVSLNIQVGDSIEFKEKHIFHCVCIS